MKMSFLDYYKLILEKVSFDPQLFKKEFKKAISSIEQHERDQLLEWMKNRGLQADMIQMNNSNSKARIMDNRINKISSFKVER